MNIWDGTPRPLIFWQARNGFSAGKFLMSESIQFSCVITAVKDVPEGLENLTIGCGYNDRKTEKKYSFSENVAPGSTDLRVEQLFEEELNEELINDILCNPKQILEIICKQGNVETCHHSVDLTQIVDCDEFEKCVELELVPPVKETKKKRTARGKNKKPEVVDIAQKIIISVQYTIGVNQSLITPEDRRSGNFLTLNIQDIVNLPKTLHPPEPPAKGPPKDYAFNYSLFIPIPVSEKDVKMYEITNGHIEETKIEKVKEEEEEEEVEGEGEKEVVLKDPNEEEEEGKAYVIRFGDLDRVKRFYISPRGMKIFGNLADYRKPFKLQFARNLAAVITTKDPTIEDYNREKYKAEISIRLDSLMSPGCREVGGEKYQFSTIQYQKRSEDEEKKLKKKKWKKGYPVVLMPEDETHPETPYEEAQTSINILLSLRSPMICHPRDRPRPMIKLSDLIPSREPVTYKEDPTDLFREEVQKISNLLISEYDKLQKTKIEQQQQQNKSQIEEKGDQVEEEEEDDDDDDDDDDIEKTKRKKKGEAQDEMQRSEEEVTRKDYVFELNRTGIYAAFKEKLERRVDEVISDRFPSLLQSSRSGDEGESESEAEERRDRIYSQLYMFLIQEVHGVLNEMFDDSITEKRDVSSYEKDMYDRLIRFARESELLEHHSLARRCYEERIVMSKSALDEKNKLEERRRRKREKLREEMKKGAGKEEEEMEGESDDDDDLFGDDDEDKDLDEVYGKKFPAVSRVCYDYGMYCLRSGEYERSEFQFKEGLQYNVKDVEMLLGYGVLLCEMEKYEESEVFFQSIVDLEGESYRNWNFLRLYFMLVGRPKDEHQSTVMARKFYEQKQQQQKQQKGDDKEVEEEEKVKRLDEEMWMELVDELILMGADNVAKKVLTSDRLDFHQTFRGNFNQARILAKTEMYEMSEEHLEASILKRPRSVLGWVWLGHIYFLRGLKDDALKHYEKAFSLFYEGKYNDNDSNKDDDEQPERFDFLKDKSLVLMFLRLGDIYLEKEMFKDAEMSYLESVKLWSCGVTWMGVGKGYFRSGMMKKAEIALNEANIQNNRNPEVWMYLCLVCIQSDSNRVQEACRCLREAKKNNIADEELVEEVKDWFQKRDLIREFNQIMLQ